MAQGLFGSQARPGMSGVGCSGNSIRKKAMGYLGSLSGSTLGDDPINAPTTTAETPATAAQTAQEQTVMTAIPAGMRSWWTGASTIQKVAVVGGIAYLAKKFLLK